MIHYRNKAHKMNKKFKNLTKPNKNLLKIMSKNKIKAKYKTKNKKNNPTKLIEPHQIVSIIMNPLSLLFATDM